jgi:hypothetical protein
LLDINKIYAQIESLSSFQKQRSIDLENAIKSATKQLDVASDNVDALRQKIINASRPALIAIPVEENPAKAYDTPVCPSSYTVLSTDGSQIEPSRHNSHPAFLINVGTVIIGYDNHHGYSFSNEPSLFFKEDDTIQVFGGEERPVAGSVLAALRQKMEAVKLTEMIEACKNSPAIALVDGTLILWTLEQQADRLSSLSNRDLKLKSFHSFMNLLNTGKENDTPIAGYISSPAGSDVVSMLRVSMCPFTQIECNKCQNNSSIGQTAKPCEALDGVTDSTLFNRILNEGQRSSLFESRSEILKAYGKLNPYGDESVYFFYLNTGTEIARIEIPKWVALGQNSRAKATGELSPLDLVHTTCQDQAVKGRGYPIAIAEAHEQAVIKGADRELFHQLVERALIKQCVSFRKSNKATRKRGGLI